MVVGSVLRHSLRHFDFRFTSSHVLPITEDEHCCLIKLLGAVVYETHDCVGIRCNR